MIVLAPLTLSACGSGSGGGWAGNYVGGTVPVECVPFARALSGVRLSGAAADWWWAADGRYGRGYAPEVGSVLVLRRTGQLPYGHVGVVSRVVSRREILVTQANWVHHRVTEDQPVIDVSPAGDWSVVRMWWPPSGQMGVTEYPAYGFISAARSASHDGLLAATPGAIRMAMAGG
jgi:hypothetical protein